MLKLLAQRLALVIPTLLLASVLVFMLVHLMPGDPATSILGDNATHEEIERIRLQLGLYDPLPVQFWNWLTSAVQLDFGTSLLTREPVSAAIARTLPATAQMVVGAMIISTVFGTLTGVFASQRPHGMLDRVLSAITGLGISIPNFWLGLILVSVFAVGLGWLPATGWVPFPQNPAEAIRFAILPSIALGTVGAAEVARQLRSAMVEAQSTEYVRTLRAAGIHPLRIVWVHALKNSAVPLVTIIGLQMNRFLGATVVIESVFGIGGMGTLVVAATQTRDMPVVQGVMVVMVLIVLAVNFAVDIVHRLIDPRVQS